MTHPFLQAAADLLDARGIATLRYQFPYMERGSRRPDPPALCHATVRCAVAEATRRCPAALFAGGRSFGCRMTSQAHAADPLPGVRGLAFLGFPLHPAKRPGTARAQHLTQIEVPMLFLQGSRDELAELELLRRVIATLQAPVALQEFAGANHAFHVLARSGRTDAMVLTELADCLAAWMQATSNEGH
jgi:predicted alpha/beta-hydrolase family hydrolase